MKIDLNHLLDEDILSPAEERTVRRMVSYNICTRPSQTHGIVRNVIEFKVNDDSTEGYNSYSNDFGNLSRDKKYIYKSVMFKIVRHFSPRIHCQSTIKELKRLLSDTREEDHQLILDVSFSGERHSFLVIHYNYMKMKNLYKAVMLVKGLK